MKRSTARSQDCLAGRLCAWVLSQFNLGVGYERFMSGVKDAALSGWVVCARVCLYVNVCLFPRVGVRLCSCFFRVCVCVCVYECI